MFDVPPKKKHDNEVESENRKRAIGSFALLAHS